MDITKTTTKKLRSILKWVLWVLLVQLVLINISASIYAYKFTHFYDSPPLITSSQNVFQKTWKLFVGPKFYKNTIEPEPPFPYETVSFEVDDNILIDAWYSQVDSSTTCVIFFHGITVNKSFYNMEAAKMLQLGCNVMMVDLRAHGKSSGHTTTFGVKETGEVQKSFEWVRNRGNKKIILYGGSLGAAICIKAAAEKKVYPNGIIANMPFGSLQEHLNARARNLGFPSEPFASLVTMWIGIERGFNGFKHKVSDYANKVNCPVLLQWGAKDSYVNREEINRIFSNLGSAQKKLVIYPFADHESLLKADPNAWQNEVQSFINMIR